MKLHYMIIYGNPVDGLGFYGPFKERDDAIIWASENFHSNETWWVGELEAPAK